MARRKPKPKLKSALSPIHYCPECGAARRGKSLLEHCVAKHGGRLPMVLSIEDTEYARAIAVLSCQELAR